MKKIYLIAFFALHTAFITAQVDTSYFAKYRGKHPFSKILCELNNPNSVNRKQWMDDRLSRESVIRYCDSIIDRSWTFLITYEDYKEAKKENSTDSVQIQVVQMIQQSSNSDTVVQMLKDTSAQGVIDKESYRALGKWMLLQLVDPLIYFLSLDNHNIDEYEIRLNLSVIQKLYTIQIVNNNYDYRMRAGSLLISDVLQIRNKRLIGERLAVIESRNFVLYQSPGSQNRKAESIDLFMDNDFFFFNGNNQDREYTGGGALSVSTDYFKFRFFKLGWAVKNSFDGDVVSCGQKNTDRRKVILNTGEALSYQSIKLGMHFYTPYIRYRDNIPLADTLFQHDRPFASFIYLERSKYRIWPKGLFRQQGNLQIGMIGSNAGRDIQALLHRDAVTSSQKVYGWDTQIANGGRWLVQLNQRMDMMLFSTTNKFATVFYPSRQAKGRKGGWNYFGFNLYSSTEVMLGGYYSALGTGFCVSLLDFTKQSGQVLMSSYKRKPTRIRDFDFGMNVEAGIRYRYILHNSTLEGFGYLNTFEDDDFDDEATSIYALDKTQVTRNVFIGELKFAFRWRKMVFYYQAFLQTKEYTTSTPDYSTMTTTPGMNNIPYYNDTNVVELRDFNGMKTYGYGRFGVVWVIEGGSEYR